MHLTQSEWGQEVKQGPVVARGDSKVNKGESTASFSDAPSAHQRPGDRKKFPRSVSTIS